MIKAITLVGSGNVAWHLALALKAIGVSIKAIVARNAVAGKELTIACNSSWFARIDEVQEVGDAIIIAIKDDAYATLHFPSRFATTLIAHTSGSKPYTILSNELTNRAVFYPLQTFSKTKALNIHAIPIMVEGEQQDSVEALKALALSLGAQPYLLNHEQRLKVHLAAVFVNNFCNHLLQVAQYMLTDAEIPVEIVKKLAEETVSKAFDIGAFEAQTGPAKRNDYSVLENHKQLMQGNEVYLRLYNTLTESIIKTYQSKQ